MQPYKAGLCYARKFMSSENKVISKLYMFRLVFIGRDDVPLAIERPERIPEKVGRIVDALYFTEPVPVLSKARHDTPGQFVSS